MCILWFVCASVKTFVPYNSLILPVGRLYMNFDFDFDSYGRKAVVGRCSRDMSYNRKTRKASEQEKVLTTAC